MYWEIPLTTGRLRCAFEPQDRDTIELRTVEGPCDGLWPVCGASGIIHVGLGLGGRQVLRLVERVWCIRTAFTLVTSMNLVVIWTLASQKGFDSIYATPVFAHTVFTQVA